MNKPKSNSTKNIEGWNGLISNQENEAELEWATVDWKKIEKTVFKLQKRIYAASRCGDIKRVRKLQKTLMRSWSNRMLAVRRVTQENQGKKTAGVDGVKSLTPKQRLTLVKSLSITGKSKPTRRVWIAKPGTDEKRALGIPAMSDRALQAVIKAALEPEWEAVFEINSFGFRPGRSCHDAIWTIKNAIQGKAKFVLDADIARCFDNINHLALLQKLNIRGKVRQQIKAWLKSKVIDQGALTATSKGTQQGGVISPLLANIALHGLEIMLKEFAKRLDVRNQYGRQASWQVKVRALTYVRYADDFLVIHHDQAVVTRCRELISEWLKGMGLELKPNKTRITHTLIPELSEDGIAGFDFLGYNIRQYPAGKHRSAKNGQRQIIGFNTLIIPTEKALKVHQQEIGRIIREHKNAPQAQLILKLNPLIRGWAAYYNFSDASTFGIFAKQDHLIYLKLRSWARYRCGTTKSGHEKYWTTIGDNNWVFATGKGKANPFRLLTHTEFGSSSTKYVKVKSDKSPYDGNLVYWSSRMGRHPEVLTRTAILLKRQKGKCVHCGLHFREKDVMEVDHIKPKSIDLLQKYFVL